MRSRYVAALMSARCVKACGKITEVFSTGAELLGIESNVVSIPEHLVEKQASLFELMRPGKTFNKPE